VTDLADRLQELAEGAAHQMRPPGADLARRQGRRRRRRLAAGVALATILAVGLVVREGRLADWSAPAPAPPASPGADIQWPTPRQVKVTGVVEVGRGQLPDGGTWRLEAGKFDRPNPDGKRELVGNLVVAFPGQAEVRTEGTFEEPVRLGIPEAILTENDPELPVRPVYGAASRRTARVVVTPKQGQFAVLSPVPAMLLDGGPRLPAKFWVAFLPPGQGIHQTRTYDAEGRELCRLDGDSIAPRCTG
jgi:hypothetical protein